MLKIFESKNSEDSFSRIVIGARENYKQLLVDSLMRVSIAVRENLVMNLPTYKFVYQQVLCVLFGNAIPLRKV